MLDRLPLGKGFSAEAGWFALLGSAAGESGEALDAGVAQMMADRGWRMQDGSGVSPLHAYRGARPTLGALESMAGGETPDPDLLTRLARAALFGVAEPA